MPARSVRTVSAWVALSVPSQGRMAVDEGVIRQRLRQPVHRQVVAQGPDRRRGPQLGPAAVGLGGGGEGGQREGLPL